MQKLHLVGFTTDREGLILSARRGARSGGYVLVVDEALEEAVEELRARRVEEEAAAREAAESEERSATSRTESALSVREIQARLRQGHSVEEVAQAAGVAPEWVERFSAPVLAERARVVDLVRSVPLHRARLGRSAQPIGTAVRNHLADRGIVLTEDEYDAAWQAHQVTDGRWAVRFRYRYRGRDHTLQFDLDEASGSVTAADRASGQLGYVAPPTPARPARAELVVAAPSDTGTRARRGSPPGPTSRAALERARAADEMRRAAAKRAADAERAAARRARERAAEKARREREAARAAAKKAAAKKAAAKKAAAKKAAAKRAAAKRAAAKTTAATKRAPERKAPATARAATESAATKPAPAKTTAAKTTPAARRRTAARTTPPVTTIPSRPAVPERPASQPTPTVPPTAPAANVTPTAAASGPAPPPAVAARPATTSPPTTPETGGEPTRAVFRPGLVEQVAGTARPPVDGRPVSGNGAPLRRPLGRPRRTRPLRAT